MIYLFLLFFTDIPFNSLPISKKTLSGFNDFGRIEKTIKLDSNTLIGSVDHVSIDYQRGLVYIGEYDANQPILVFDEAGGFVRTISRKGNGPGEIKERVTDMGVKSNGNIVILSPGYLTEFAPDGSLIKELNIIPYFGDKLAITGNDVFAEIYSRGMGKEDDFRISLYKERELKQRFGAHDIRRSHYNFSLSNSIRIWGDQIWIPEVYEPTINIYSKKGDLIKRIVREQPSKKKFDELWSGQLTEEKRRSIKKTSHRFVDSFYFKDELILIEFMRSPELRVYMIGFTKKGTATFYSGYLPMDPTYSNNTLSFDYVVGHYPNGFIATLEHNESYERWKKEYPAFKNIDLTPDDNPLLVFVTPK